ncbi:high-affinity branched-chain amino acid transport ATP-binding protein LivF [bacterium BMS3Bbin02]|nr:high-affinity branched-chain amino acid transport ATP-binding protein LivF [bacterium BMS3Bbin02]
MLEVANLEVVYNDVVLVLRGISIEVPEGEIVALLGANGAGKTTTIRAITGLLDVHEGDITKGRISWKGEAIEKMDPADIVRAGITQVLEGRRIFAEMTVDENLKTGAFTSKSKVSEAAAYDRVMTMFPILADRRSSISGYLSGGEQQMLAMARALMADPELLILDEPSLGLAPKLVQQVKEIIVEINKQGTGVLLIEQNANMALSIAGHGYIMETGKVVMDGASDKLLQDEDVQEFYLGLHVSGERKSFKDIKHYKRRKRWLS